MKKKEFLNKLYEALCDNMSEKEASAHIDYYKAYIEGQCDKGRNEKEVIEELGNPRLIAKTIIGMGISSYNESRNSDNDQYNSYEYGEYSRNKYNSEYDNYGRGSNKKKKRGIFFNSNLTMKQKLKLLAVIAIVLLLIGIMFIYAISMVLTFVRLVIKFIVPISIIIGAYYIYKVIKE